jgi:hypothetical protein
MASVDNGMIVTSVSTTIVALVRAVVLFPVMLAGA